MSRPEINISNLLKFLSYLQDRKIFYSIDQRREDSIMITATLLGQRIEIDVRENGVEYSIFTGDEKVLDEEADLYDLLERSSN